MPSARTANKRPKQLPLEFRTWGGKRAGAGRKNKSGRKAHVKRPKLLGRHPIHVTLKVLSHVPSLQSQKAFSVFKEAAEKARAQGLQMSHYSVQSNHIHLIVECWNNRELERALKSFTIRLARGLNRTFQLKGPVFHGRFHMHVLTTPSEVRHALKYVLLNETKHTRKVTKLDHLSSGHQFKEWPRLIGRSWRTRIIPPRHGDRKRLTALHGSLCVDPRTWLLKTGWQRVVDQDLLSPDRTVRAWPRLP